MWAGDDFASHACGSSGAKPASRTHAESIRLIEDTHYAEPLVKDIASWMNLVEDIHLAEHWYRKSTLGCGWGGLGRTFTPKVNILQELQFVEEHIAGHFGMLLCIHRVKPEQAMIRTQQA